MPAAPKNKKVLVATPAYGSLVTLNYLNGIISLLTTKIDGWLFAFRNIGNEALIQRARQFLAQYAIANDFDKLLFIDADIGFSGEDVKRIINHDKPVVGGLYPVKKIPPYLNFNPLPGHDLKEFGKINDLDGIKKYAAKYGDSQELVEVVHVPTGFLCIDVSVLKQVSGSVPAYKNSKSSGYPDIGKIPELFPVRIKNGALESEDWAFCSLCRENNIKIYLDTRIILTHSANIVVDIRQNF